MSTKGLIALLILMIVFTIIVSVVTVVKTDRRIDQTENMLVELIEADDYVVGTVVDNRFGMFETGLVIYNERYDDVIEIPHVTEKYNVGDRVLVIETFDDRYIIYKLP